MRLWLHVGGEPIRLEVDETTVVGPTDAVVLRLDPTMGLGIRSGLGPFALLWSGTEFAAVSPLVCMCGHTETAVLQVHSTEAGDFALVVSEIDLEVHGLRPFRRTCRISLAEIVLEARLQDDVLETKDLAGQVTRYSWVGPELWRIS